MLESIREGGNMRAKASVKAWCVLGLFLALQVVGPAWGEPVRLTSPIEKLETLQGAAVVRKTGQALVVNLPSQDGQGRWFRIEAGQGAWLPAGFRADSAQVHFWMGHLVLITDDKAWHFSVPGLDAFVSDAAQVPDAAELASLTRGYDLEEVQASAIYSASGPRANRLNEGLRSIVANADDQQDPGSSGGGSCGTSCTISCGDGSSCSASCGGTRCAQCTCPASCSCS